MVKEKNKTSAMLNSICNLYIQLYSPEGRKTVLNLFLRLILTELGLRLWVHAVPILFLFYFIPFIFSLSLPY